MRFKQDKWILAGAVAAVLVAGCGRKAPPVAGPILLDEEPAAEAPMAPSTFESAPTEPAPPSAPELGSTEGALDPLMPASGAADVVASATPDLAASAVIDPVATDVVASSPAELAKLAEDEAKRKADEAEAGRKADEEARRAAEEKARRKAEEEARRKADELAALTPTFDRAIGQGGLRGALGIALDGANMFVVDNARTGLLGKFSSVRKYEIATGKFLTSVEDVGLMGARNLPTTVDRVKIQGGKILAADASSTWTFDNTGILMTTVAGSFDVVKSVAVPGSTDLYRIHDGKLQRVEADGDVRLTLSNFEANGEDDAIGNPVALAIDAVGTLFVTDNGSKPRVLVFKAASK
jgi:hypothetical protein